MKSTIEVSEKHLRANVEAIHQALSEASTPPATLLAVVKANAYGHGAALCAPILARAGVPWLGTTDAIEGALVRRNLAPSSPTEILIMSGPPSDAPSAREAARLAIDHRLTPVVWNPAQLAPLAEAATRAATIVPIHLEIDTGMSRQGAAPGPALEAFLTALATHPNLRLDGIFTHFASSEDSEATQTLTQMDLFESAIRSIAAAGFQPRWLHIGNTSTVDNGSAPSAPILARLQSLAAEMGAKPLARSGLGLYGLALPLDPPSPNAARLRPNLRPVLTWKTTITSITEIPTGARVGYSATFTAPHPMRLALLPIGYADGLRRELSSTEAHPGGWVMIHGHRAPIVGRISMNLTTVDVTDIPAAQPGDPAILIGEGISAEDHARLAHTIPYEILCGMRGTPVAG